MFVANVKLTFCFVVLCVLVAQVYCDVHRIILKTEKSNKSKKNSTPLRHSSTKLSLTKKRPTYNDQIDEFFTHDQNSNGWKPVRAYYTNQPKNSKPNYENKRHRSKKKIPASSKSLVDQIEFTTSSPQHIPIIDNDYNEFYYENLENNNEHLGMKSVVKKPAAYETFEQTEIINYGQDNKNIYGNLENTKNPYKLKGNKNKYQNNPEEEVSSYYLEDQEESNLNLNNNYESLENRKPFKLNNNLQNYNNNLHNYNNKLKYTSNNLKNNLKYTNNNLKLNANFGNQHNLKFGDKYKITNNENQDNLKNDYDNYEDSSSYNNNYNVHDYHNNIKQKNPNIYEYNNQYENNYHKPTFQNSQNAPFDTTNLNFKKQKSPFSNTNPPFKNQNPQFGNTNPIFKNQNPTYGNTNLNFKNQNSPNQHKYLTQTTKLPFQSSTDYKNYVTLATTYHNNRIKPNRYKNGPQKNSKRNQNPNLDSAFAQNQNNNIFAVKPEQEELPTYEVHEDVHDFYFPRPNIYFNIAPTVPYANNNNTKTENYKEEETEMTSKRPRIRKNKKQQKTTHIKMENKEDTEELDNSSE